VLGKLERATDRGFSLTPESLEGIGEAEARRSRWIAAALWVIAALLAFTVFG
jgi:ubiquinone biosynthesis protein